MILDFPVGSFLRTCHPSKDDGDVAGLVSSSNVAGATEAGGPPGTTASMPDP
jgi:hypothetical protein